MAQQKCNRCGKVWDYHTDYGGCCLDCEKILHKKKVLADKITFWAFATVIVAVVLYALT